MTTYTGTTVASSVGNSEVTNHHELVPTTSATPANADAKVAAEQASDERGGLVTATVFTRGDDDGHAQNGNHRSPHRSGNEAFYRAVSRTVILALVATFTWIDSRKSRAPERTSPSVATCPAPELGEAKPSASEGAWPGSLHAQAPRTWTLGEANNGSTIQVTTADAIVVSLATAVASTDQWLVGRDGGLGAPLAERTPPRGNAANAATQTFTWKSLTVGIHAVSLVHSHSGDGTLLDTFDITVIVTTP